MRKVNLNAKVNKLLYKAKALLEKAIDLSDVIASGVNEATPMKKESKKRAKRNSKKA